MRLVFVVDFPTAADGFVICWCCCAQPKLNTSTGQLGVCAPPLSPSSSSASQAFWRLLQLLQLQHFGIHGAAAMVKHAFQLAFLAQGPFDPSACRAKAPAVVHQLTSLARTASWMLAWLPSLASSSPWLCTSSTNTAVAVTTSRHGLPQEKRLLRYVTPHTNSGFVASGTFKMRRLRGWEGDCVVGCQNHAVSWGSTVS